MISGVTFQVTVSDFQQGLEWYTKLFGRKPDFLPPEDFVEWQIVPNAWLQVGEGSPLRGRPIRFGVSNIVQERERIQRELNVQVSPIERLEGVAAWCNFTDPFGNQLGLFQDLA